MATYENPIVMRLGIRFALRNLEDLLRLYGYGEFFLVRSVEGRLSWTGLGLEKDFEKKVFYYDVVATVEV